MIDWNGIGEPTKNLEKRVRVRLRDGAETTTRVGALRWKHTGAEDDIVKYEFFDGVISLFDARFDEPTPATDESKRRKGMPLFDGCFLYFPDALLAVAEHSRKANEKHNPGEALHWSKHKSNDHPNCTARHMVDMGPNWDQIDPEFGSLHAVAGAWRALATAQIAIEAQRAGMTPRAYLKKLTEEAA